MLEASLLEPCLEGLSSKETRPECKAKGLPKGRVWTRFFRVLEGLQPQKMRKP